MTTGPYHQAGPVKLMTFTRSGLTWMFVAMTSMRLESSAGICDSQGIHSNLMVLTPSQSSTALLISTSMPLASLVSGSRIECGAIVRFAERDAVLARPVERAVGAILEHRLRLLVEVVGPRRGRKRRGAGDDAGERDKNHFRLRFLPFLF